MSGIGQLHFSIDDVGRSLRWLTVNCPGSLFDMRLFSKLREWHEDFGLIVTLYCFTEVDGFSIEEIPMRYATELETCSGWLRFGFHGINENPFFETPDFKEGFFLFKTVMDRLRAGQTGTLRLHNWFATGEQKKFLASEGIKILLYPDDDGLPYDENDSFFENGLFHQRTRIRFERIPHADEETVHFASPLVCAFTHEWCFEKYAEKIENSLRRWSKDGYGFI